MKNKTIDLPSRIPSKIPSDIPSDIPSNIPSISPSYTSTLTVTAAAQDSSYEFHQNGLFYAMIIIGVLIMVTVTMAKCIFDLKKQLNKSKRQLLEFEQSTSVPIHEKIRNSRKSNSSNANVNANVNKVASFDVLTKVGSLSVSEDVQIKYGYGSDFGSQPSQQDLQLELQHARAEPPVDKLGANNINNANVDELYEKGSDGKNNLSPPGSPYPLTTDGQATPGDKTEGEREEN